MINEDEIFFKKACDEIIDKYRESNGIGTLQEKTLHAVLKQFYEPNIKHQEIKIDKFVADIFRDDEIIEIQTRNFNSLRKKLDVFLNLYPVTIVYPIPNNKWISWIDNSTGVVSKKRKSPKKGTLYDAFYELYKIKPYLNHPHLSICLVLIDIEEYRLLNGWNHNKKRGSTRHDRIPTKFISEHFLRVKEDYKCVIPDNLPLPFTSKDFAKCAKINSRTSNLALNILTYIGTVKRVGKKGNAYLYEIS